MSDNWIYRYIRDLVNAKFITKEEALNYVEIFKKKGKLSEEEIKDLLLLIESKY